MQKEAEVVCNFMSLEMKCSGAHPWLSPSLPLYLPVMLMGCDCPAHHKVKHTLKVLLESLFNGVPKCGSCQCLLQCPPNKSFIYGTCSTGTKVSIIYL